LAAFPASDPCRKADAQMLLKTEAPAGIIGALANNLEEIDHFVTPIHGFFTVFFKLMQISNFPNIKPYLL
jgi:hypothetical protein